MSKPVERMEKNCLNCGVQVLGRFCQNCGQENKELKQSFWQMGKHFVYDIFHFDGKFFLTLKMLFVRPGKLALDYASGKQAAHLDPIRMYLFLSTITFLIYPIVINLQSHMGEVHIVATPSERLKEGARQYDVIRQDSGSLTARKSLDAIFDTSVSLVITDINDTTSNAINFPIDGKEYKAVPVKTSALFPERNWFESRLSRNLRAEFEKQGENINKVIQKQNSLLLKMMPYLFFLSLPVFAVFLKLLYRDKKRAFSDHGIFTLYHYIAWFIFLLIFLLVQLVIQLLHINILLYLYASLILFWLVYLTTELKHFYKENWGKTLLKSLSLSLLSFTTFILLVLLFVVLNLLI